MGHQYENQLTDEERRDFLKALGVGGAVAASSATLTHVQDAVTATDSKMLAPVGQAIQEDLTADIDATLLAEQQSAHVEAASALPAVLERGLPEKELRTDFAQVAEAGRPIYDHLGQIGFFESTMQHLPELSPEYLANSVKTVLNTGVLSTALADIGFDDTAMLDLVGTVVNGRHQLSQQLWHATDQLPREAIRAGEFVPPMTKQAAGGVQLWLADIDAHLVKKRQLLTKEILRDITWDAHAMAAGFQLMTEAATRIGEGTGELSEDELAALLTTGFATQTIAQNLLPLDGYWITEEMRGARRTDLETVTADLETIKNETITGW